MTEKQKYQWLLTWVNSCILDSQLDTCENTAREILNDKYFTDLKEKIEIKKSLPATHFIPEQYEQTK